MMQEAEFTVSEFVAVLNQTLEYAYPSVRVTGELANFKVSKNRWIYFDLKDESAMVRFFGTIYQLPGPLEDGMVVAVKGVPRLHPQYGFSVTVQSIKPVGEGSIKKAAQLLEAKLAAEGLFEMERKRQLPYPPMTIGLITSAESAAYRDFVKVLSGRWGGLSISLIDVQVQGESAPDQIIAAIEQFNGLAVPPEVVVVTRGGGSAEDLQAFSVERVVRAVAASRIPTLVAIGHEVDISLAELAADRRASTPSNAAELLVPDRGALLSELWSQRTSLHGLAKNAIFTATQRLHVAHEHLQASADTIVFQAKQHLGLRAQIIQAFDPQLALKRGYALVRLEGKYVYSGGDIQEGDELQLQLVDAKVLANVQKITMVKEEAQDAKG